MQPRLYSLPPLLLLLSFGPACHGDDPVEGQNPGECADGADNDSDGQFDCDDPDCFGSPDCEADTDTDSDADTDTDTDSDADTDTGPPDVHNDGSYCDENTLILPDGTTIDCEELHGYCGETEGGEGACMWYEGGGSNDESTPAFLIHPLGHDATVVNGWYYNYAGNGAGNYHGAIDFQASESTELHAACDGVAMKSSQYNGGYGYGNFIQIRCDQSDGDGNRYHLVYGHVQSAVSSIVVYAQADRRNTDYGSWTPVSAGDLIGYSGSEDTSWAHLHFEVNLATYAGPDVDPYDLYAETTGASASAEQEYPPDGARYTGCGEYFLWSTCPPTVGSAACSIDVTYPDGGETLYQDAPTTVLWDSDCAANVKVEVYKSGSIHQQLAADEVNDGELEFTPDSSLCPEGSDYTICVTTTDEAVSSCSASSFTIAASATDADGDGYDAASDCDDSDASIHPGAAETCDGEDDNCDGVVDETSSCWVAIYRFVDATTGAHCWNDSTSAPSACSGYAYELEAWIARATGVADTWHAVQCSLDTDHIIVEYDTSSSSDYTALQGAGYDCASADLGYIYDLGSGPASGTTPFASSCDLYRFSGTTSAGTGEHLFTRDETSVSGYTCELPVRGEVLTDHSCFGGVPSGC